ncbi:unnamed protein product [Mycena citricolor]|uniref:Ubiquitin-like domain-containing protein n=1 Tax=Mycena citricolor TaxID=2018698 RepID=A0AAD2GXH3_9AGAR|nr:unnamed protein product [Mycena citricolor]
MSQEHEDVKPKLELTLVFNDKPITVKVKSNTKFAKIFAAAEQRFGKEPGTFKFVHEDKRISKDETPADLGLENEDQIDCFLEQVGGGSRTALRSRHSHSSRSEQ